MQPRLSKASLGGSDARVIMGNDGAALLRLGRKNGAKQSRLIIRGIYWSSSGSRPNA
jgi:hypothetical protein